MAMMIRATGQTSAEDEARHRLRKMQILNSKDEVQVMRAAVFHGNAKDADLNSKNGVIEEIPSSPIQV
jgi:hypothetical protein